MGPKHQTFWGLRTSFPPRGIHNNPRSKCARVPQAMAQFVLKIEKLSHIMGTAPIVELVRPYGLHPQLGLLAQSNISYLLISYFLFIKYLFPSRLKQRKSQARKRFRYPVV